MSDSPRPKPNVDALIAEQFGGKCRVRIPKNRWEDIRAGARFWSYTKAFMSDNELQGELLQEKWRLITITHVRSEVAFYLIDGSPHEEHFEKGSAMVGLLEPETYKSDLDPQYYEAVSRSGKVIITYSRPMDRHAILWQYRWLNPGQENQPPSMLQWEILKPAAGQTIESRVEEIRSYKSDDGKPQYEARPLHLDPLSVLKLMSPQERLGILKVFCPHCGTEQPAGQCQCWNDE